MQIVIDIPEEVYRKAKETHDVMCDSVWLGIKYGTPLPKGHGRLKDIDKIINDGISKGFCEWYDEMKYAPTIIEADKEKLG